MRVFSIILVLLILGVWIYCGLQALLIAKKETAGRRWVVCTAAILLMVGACGFFGSALAATGGLNWLPSSFEWPVGLAHGVVTTDDHFFVVPHEPAGRVQVYDRDWKFLRGWQVEASGGKFKLDVTETNRIHVLTARGHRHYVFDIDGKLLSKEKDLLESYSSVSSRQQSQVVPTAPWLWVFSSPALSWLAAMMGLIGLGLTRKKRTA